MSEAQIRIGIGGWTYPPWRGVFYPDKLPQSKELEYASRAADRDRDQRDLLRRQKPEELGNMGARPSPDGFQFAVKGSRYCVMRLEARRSAAKGIGNFFAQGFAALGPKLGPILWQFAPRRKFDRDDIAGFIDLLPEKLDGITLRHAIEPRHDSFRDEKFFELCRARNIAVVFEDFDDYPCIEADTADFAYARLQRMNEEVETGYDDAALDGFAEARPRNGRRTAATPTFS